MKRIFAFLISVAAVVTLGTTTVSAQQNWDENGNWIGTTAENITYYSQNDGRWAYTYVGEGGSMSGTGCVPTVGAMVLSHFGYYMTPLDVAYQMNYWGHYNSWYGHGTDSGVWNTLAANYGLSVWGYMDRDSILYALQNDMLVTACVQMGSGWTHCILLAGLDWDGRTTVYDPIYGVYTDYVDNIIWRQSYDWVDLVDGGPFIAIGW